MALLEQFLELSRCPHCGIDTPNLDTVWETRTKDSKQKNLRYWRVYRCKRCGGLVTAFAMSEKGYVSDFYPPFKVIDVNIPKKAGVFLEQALNSLQQTSGAIMLAASAVDSMLKDKGYIEGNLNTRIETAAKDHLITDGMKEWAHQVRLDANIQRHADNEAPLPNDNDAKITVDFALALAEFLYVLPSKVSKGISDSKPKEESSEPPVKT